MDLPIITLNPTDHAGIIAVTAPGDFYAWHQSGDSRIALDKSMYPTGNQPHIPKPEPSDKIRAFYVLPPQLQGNAFWEFNQTIKDDGLVDFTPRPDHEREYIRAAFAARDHTFATTYGNFPWDPKHVGTEALKAIRGNIAEIEAGLEKWKELERQAQLVGKFPGAQAGN